MDAWKVGLDSWKAEMNDWDAGKHIEGSYQAFKQCGTRLPILGWRQGDPAGGNWPPATAPDYRDSSTHLTISDA